MDGVAINELYSEIFRRKSVRRYENKIINKDLEEKINNAINDLFPLNDKPAAFQFLSTDKAGVSFGKAPYCICAYAEDNDDAKLNVAFLLQEMSLKLSCLGLGSCWLGKVKPKANFTQYKGLPFFMLIVFGYSVENLHREIGQFKRKAFTEITSITDDKEIVEAVRLAPSGINRQGWFLSGVSNDSSSNNKIRLYMADNNFFLKKMLDPLTIADAGIALCHLVLAARHKDTFLSALYEENIPPFKKNYSYIWTVELK
ncbi:MAG: nitroreductase family protein [Treponema sp.]|jgi:nitroreductase|nr:nitroreductase family protein [Treponema sp.]